MEANSKTEKITHQLSTIQFTDKAIENLRWNKGTEKRQMISIKFKNGPIGISLRWTPKTNKKVFELIFIFKGKTSKHSCGELTPGVFTCNTLQEYLLKLNQKHKDIDRSYKTNPNSDLITGKEPKKSQSKTTREVIEARTYQYDLLK